MTMEQPLKGLGIVRPRCDSSVRLRTGVIRKTAEHGDAFAQDRLGFQYANGLGVTQDYAAAASWYRKAGETSEGWGESWAASA
jgi:TPR repeat protein